MAGNVPGPVLLCSVLTIEGFWKAQFPLVFVGGQALGIIT